MSLQHNNHVPENRPMRFEVRPYRKRMPIFWWVHNIAHLRFITRELTSVAVALYAVVLILLIQALGLGEAAYQEFWTVLRSPFSIILHAVAFLFLLFHAITWFSLAPKALVVRFGRVTIPDVVIIAANVLAWLVCSVLIAWVVAGL